MNQMEEPAETPSGTLEPFGWKILLRLEGFVVLAFALALFSELDGSWLVFAILVLVPDLSMVGYLGGDRIGAATYNAVHTYVGPALLGSAAWWLGEPENASSLDSSRASVPRSHAFARPPSAPSLPRPPPPFTILPTIRFGGWIKRKPV